MSKPLEVNKAELVAAKVTLDGHKAVITGKRNDFATVIDLQTGNRVEFAWLTCAHIVANLGGEFKS